MAHCMPECQIVENVKEFRKWCRLKQRRCKKTKALLWAREVPGKKKGTTKIITFSGTGKKTLPAEHRRAKGETEPEWELRMISLGYDRHLEPDMDYAGEYFDAWVKRIEALGYISDHRLLRSADYGDPTIRQRLFVQFVRVDTGKRIVWPDQRFIKPGAKRPSFKKNNDRYLAPWPTARDSVIEWDVKGQSIFDPARKELAAATKRRIAIGAVRFGLKDFLVPQSNFGGDRVRSTDEPVSTVQCNHRGEGLAEPFTLTSNKGFGCGIRDLDKPAATTTCNSRGEGLVEPFMIPNFGERPGQTPRTHSVDDPLPTATSHGAGGLVEADGFLISCAHGSAKPEDCNRRVSDGNKPLPALTTSNGEAVVQPASFLLAKQGTNPHMNVARDVDAPIPTVITDGRVHLVEPCIVQANGKSSVVSADDPLGTVTVRQKQPAPFILPKDQGHKGDYVASIDHPVPAVQTTAHDHMVQPCIVQMNGQSTAISADEPLGALTGMQKQYVMEPHISHLRNGNGCNSVNEPLRAQTAGDTHMLLAEAFLNVMDNAGKNGSNQRSHSVDEPLKTVTTKAGQTIAEASLEKLPAGVRFSLETLEDAINKVAPAGVDISRVMGLLEPLMEELRKAGRVDIQPWIYVYYSNGAVGADIDTPVPTVRCKEGTAVCYPVLEFDGEFMLLDILYRMLTVRELQRAQGFPSWTWSCKGSACRKQSPTSSRSASSKDADGSSAPKSTGADPGKPVAVHARIDFGRSVLVLRSARKSSESAKDAEVFWSYPLPTQIVASARELAGMLKIQEKAAYTGREVMTGRRPTPSTSPRSGLQCASSSSGAMAGNVEGVSGSVQISLEPDGGRFTTSAGGKRGRSIDSILKTLSSYVAGVMDSCTQEEIPAGSSFSLTLEVSDDFVWPAGITKTDIVKAIGNSVSCGLAAAITLAVMSQDEDISGFFDEKTTPKETTL